MSSYLPDTNVISGLTKKHPAPGVDDHTRPGSAS